ncbi:MAG: terminase small subunit [Ruminococcus flavefaciens]|nr:terminase small subunit [Ruminococcus flavefaciens]
MPVRNSKLFTFCCYYVMLGDIAESAVRAGFSRETALTEGIRLLESENCRKIISRLKSTLSDYGNVSAGLKRLAFGNCTDAVYLVFADELPPPNVIERLDLFNVSEIKRVKGGGVEVKLFDRLKALEKLFELENSFSDRNKADDLIKALSESAEDGDVIDN